jgi:hypothetical protein
MARLNDLNERLSVLTRRASTLARRLARRTVPLRGTNASYFLLIVAVGAIGGIVGAISLWLLRLFHLAFFAAASGRSSTPPRSSPGSGA